jgi:hypothetical protein
MLYSQDYFKISLDSIESVMLYLKHNRNNKQDNRKGVDMLTKERIEEIIFATMESGVLADALGKEGWEEDTNKDDWASEHEYYNAVEAIAECFFKGQKNT